MILSPCASQNHDVSTIEESFRPQNDVSSAHIVENLALAECDAIMEAVDDPHNDASLAPVAENLALAENDAPMQTVDNTPMEPVDLSVQDTLRVSSDNPQPNPNPPQCASSHSDMEPLEVPDVNVPDGDPDVDVAIQVNAPINVPFQPLQNRPPYIESVRANMPKPMPMIEEKEEEEDEASDENKEN